VMNAAIDWAMPCAAAWRQSSLVTLAASAALRMFAHSMNTLGTVEQLSPPRSDLGWMPPEPR
jgi:hypothetical protein